MIAPLLLSAKDKVALQTAAREFSIFLTGQPPSALYDITYNAAFRLEKQRYRAILYGSSTQALAQELLDFADNRDQDLTMATGTALASPAGPAFIFSGNGSQWRGMGNRFMHEDPLFRETIAEVDSFFRRHDDFSLVDDLSGTNGGGNYERTERAQPALFALQVGITQMLKRRGVFPAVVAGHSVGEVAAAWAAGILSLEDAVEVIYHRSRLQEKTKGKGKMTAVGLGLDAVRQVLAELGLAQALTIAGVNSSRGVTIAGPPEFLGRMEAALATQKLIHKRLDLDYAFHTAAMDEIEEEVREELAGVRPRASRIPFYSTVTGCLLDGQALDAEYWWNNIRKPVLFEQAIKNMLTEGINIFIEVGPHPILRSYINTSLKDRRIEGRFISTMARNDDAPQKVQEACSQALIAGASIDWQTLFPVPGHPLPLPGLPAPPEATG